MKKYIVKELVYNRKKSTSLIFEIEVHQATQMADSTKGYPFAFQVLGYLTWNHHGDYNAVREEYEQYLSEFVYDKIWSELSQKDRMVARGIADVEGGKIKRYSGTFTHGNK